MILKYFTQTDGIIKTKTKISFKCDICNKKYTRFNRDYLISKKNPYCDKDYCNKCWRKVLNNRPEYKEKMSKDPELRKLYSAKTRKAWADGKFDGVRVGQCKWYEYKHSDGKAYKVQGTWELAFIEWLDKNDLDFKCHRGRIPYTLNGQNKNYYPDFWINEWNAYADVKCEYFYDREKFKEIKKSNKKINIKILLKKDLLKLGVKL